MNIKLILNSVLSHQLYVAIFASVGIAFMFKFFFVFALILKEPAKESAKALFPFVYPLGVIWFIFFVVRIFFRTKLEFCEKGFVKKRLNKILWAINWADIEKIEFFKMPWHFFLSPNIYKGELVFSYKKDGDISRERKVNLMRKDIDKINNKFGKEIKII